MIQTKLYHNCITTNFTPQLQTNNHFQDNQKDPVVSSSEHKLVSTKNWWGSGQGCLYWISEGEQQNYMPTGDHKTTTTFCATVLHTMKRDGFVTEGNRFCTNGMLMTHDIDIPQRIHWARKRICEKSIIAFGKKTFWFFPRVDQVFLSCFMMDLSPARDSELSSTWLAGMFVWPSFVSWSHMGVSKNRGKTPKMDGL